MKKGKTIDRLEWDFGQCPKEELHDCWMYEFMRECPHILESVRTWRAAHPGKRFDDWLPIAGQASRKDRPEAGGWEAFPFYPEWPRQPYLSIPQAERERWRDRPH